MSCKKRIGAWFLMFVALVALTLSCVALRVNHISKEEHTYLDLFNKYANTQNNGVEKSMYASLATALTSYFKGEISSPQCLVIANNIETQAFKAHELVHLEDVQKLFLLIQKIGYISLAVFFSVLFIFLFSFFYKKSAFLRTNLAKIYRQAFLCFLCLIACLLLWAICNFDGFFITLHKVFFTNDLWLLNPNTDLLIQLMPTVFFIQMAQKIVLTSFVPLMMLYILMFVFCLNQRKRGNET